MSPSQTEAAEHLFDLSGGALCLDFANTVSDRPHRTREHLAGYAELLHWSRQTGLLDPAGVARLTRRAAGRPVEAEGVFDRALRLREVIYRVFSALAAGGRPEERDLATLNRAVNQALPLLRVEMDGERSFSWGWATPQGALDGMLWPVVRSAADLLTSDEVQFVRECASEECSWLFVDRSRTRRRRWCDMKICGNRAKARRHYARAKKRRERGRRPSSRPAGSGLHYPNGHPKTRRRAGDRSAPSAGRLRGGTRSWTYGRRPF